LKILVINNDGGGFTDYVNVGDGTTVEQLFKSHCPSADASSYLIRVNRHPCASDQRLSEGDRISITPTKIEGAATIRRRSAATCLRVSRHHCSG